MDGKGLSKRDGEGNMQKRVNAEAVSVIQYEGDGNALVWKHPIDNFTMGSQLIVHESQEALFLRNGEALDLFPPGHFFLETQNLPYMDKVYKLPTETGQIFQAEVYFVDKTTRMGIKWGTDSKVRMFEPSSGIHIELGACGEFSLGVIDSRKLVVKLVGTDQMLSQNQLLSANATGSGQAGVQGYFKAMILTLVKSDLVQVIKENGINILEIDEHLEKISSSLKEKINIGLVEYGLVMPEFFVTRVLTPDDDPNFKRMKQQYADQYLKIREEEIRQAEARALAERKVVEMEMEARLKIIQAQGEAESVKIRGEADAAAYRMQAQAEAEEMRLKGYTYAEETARQVGVGMVEHGFGTVGAGDGGVGEGSGGSGVMGDLVNLGIGLSAMSNVMGITKDAMSPIMDNTKGIGQALGGVMTPDSWNCTCGAMGINGNFCSNCGRKRGEMNVQGEK